MDILIVSATAPPKNSPESLQTGRYIKHLAATHDVTLVTSKVIKGWEPFDPSVAQYLNKVKKVITLTALPHRIVALLKKVARSTVFPDEAFYFTRQAGKVTRSTQRPDIIFSRSLPFSSSLLAKTLTIHWGVPWLMHLSDPWVDSPFLKLKPEEKRRHQEQERECVARAKIVTLSSKKTVAFYKTKYAEYAHKFMLLPNVFDDDHINTDPVRFDGPLQFVFTGRLYGKRSIEALLDVLKKASAMIADFQLKTEFLFAGFFDQENIVSIASSGLANVRYLGPVSMAEATALQRKASVLISIDVFSENDEMYNLFFPSKLLDYLAARRKILALTGPRSTTHETIGEKFGWCFDVSTLGQLPFLIEKMVNRYTQRDADFFTPASDFHEYGARFNAGRLEDILKTMITEESSHVA